MVLTGVPTTFVGGSGIFISDLAITQSPPDIILSPADIILSPPVTSRFQLLTGSVYGVNPAAVVGGCVTVITRLVPI